jgi:hypothetical protein
MKIYIHHLYDKALFYTIAHNTINRKYNLSDSGEGSIFCEYKNIKIEIIFKNEISFEDDGYHILDYFNSYFNSKTDTKIGEILPDRFYMDRENQQILKKFINLLKECPENQKWIITYFRTEKILYLDDFIDSEIGENLIELESLYKQLENHYIINDNFFINNSFNLSYPNFLYTFTNTIFQWNRNLNIRWYYEFKQIFNKLNFEYNLMYSVRNHKGFRVDLLNELQKLNLEKLYLQRTDELKENKYYKKFGNNVNQDVNLSSLKGETDFEDTTYIQNIINGLDLFFRVLPKAKMQILCETWSYSKNEFNSQYLSEKTIGFILAGIPFISTHDYPLLMIEKILKVPPHPFLNESKKCRADAKLFAKFVNDFMKNYEDNYQLCKEWSDLVFDKFMYKIKNENSLFDLILNNDLKNNTIKKNLM